MGSTSECAIEDDGHERCVESWCDCGCHHGLLDEHYAGKHAMPVERCQACAQGLPTNLTPAPRAGEEVPGLVLGTFEGKPVKATYL